MIELYTADTPNGKKITILLEEIGCDFKVTAIDLSKDEQFHPEFNSTPRDGHPLFESFVAASFEHQKKQSS